MIQTDTKHRNPCPPSSCGATSYRGASRGCGGGCGNSSSSSSTTANTNFFAGSKLILVFLMSGGVIPPYNHFGGEAASFPMEVLFSFQRPLVKRLIAIVVIIRRQHPRLTSIASEALTVAFGLYSPIESVVVLYFATGDSSKFPSADLSYRLSYFIQDPTCHHGGKMNISGMHYDGLVTILFRNYYQWMQWDPYHGGFFFSIHPFS